MTVVVTGIGLVSALGSTAPATWRALLLGRSAIAQHQPFADLEPVPLAMVDTQPAKVAELLAAATTEALQDAGLTPPLGHCGVVVGSSRGQQARWEQFLRHGPDQWIDSLPHLPSAWVARQVQASGPVLAPMAACATGLWAIAQGCQLIHSGQCDRVIVGAVEAAISPLTLIGFLQMRAMAQTGCYPFDIAREGLVLGEGAVVLVLETEALARSRQAKSYGHILGAGLTADANHISAPDAGAGAGLAAIRHCLRQSRLAPESIGWIHAHGTSTQLNDAYEADIIQQLFPETTWVSSTKGATGHTLGASGALGAAFCLLALAHQTLPPCVGLTVPAFDLNFVKTAIATPLDACLCLSFGFGGQNAAIAFARCDREPSPHR